MNNEEPMITRGQAIAGLLLAPFALLWAAYEVDIDVVGMLLSLLTGGAL